MAKWLTLHPKNPQERLIKQVTEGLEVGQIMAYPSGHGYALACLYGQAQALERLYRLRELKSDHPMTLVCRDIAHIAEYAQLDTWAFKQIKFHGNKPFTYILPISKRTVRHMVWIKKRQEQGFQLPTTPLIHALVRGLSLPLVTTSLIFDDEALVEPYDIHEAIGREIDWLLDTGESITVLTTVVDFCSGESRVIRQGGEIWE